MQAWCSCLNFGPFNNCDIMERLAWVEYVITQYLEEEIQFDHSTLLYLKELGKLYLENRKLVRIPLFNAFYCHVNDINSDFRTHVRYDCTCWTTNITSSYAANVVYFLTEICEKKHNQQSRGSKLDQSATSATCVIKEFANYLHAILQPHGIKETTSSKATKLRLVNRVTQNDYFYHIIYLSHK